MVGSCVKIKTNGHVDASYNLASKVGFYESKQECPRADAGELV